MTTQLSMLCGSPYPIPTPNLITILNFVFIISFLKSLKKFIPKWYITLFSYFYILWKWHHTVRTLLLLFSLSNLLFLRFFLLVHIALVHSFTVLWITEEFKGNGFTRVVSFILLLTVAHSKKFIVTTYVCRCTHRNPSPLTHLKHRF